MSGSLQIGTRLFTAFALGLALMGCGDGAGSGDAATADADGCVDDDDCSDGIFCNGVERCQHASVGADARGCVAALAACREGQICTEDARTCTTDCAITTDADGDGAIAAECGGDDCDDSDPLRYPGAVEICDPDNRDEDCDPTTFGYRDADGDGYPDARCCNGSNCGTDCDDADPSVHPGATERCNGRDDDCDGLVDEGAGVTCWVDADSDGYAAADAERVMVCGTCGAGLTAREPTDVLTTDCDDTSAAIRPGAADDQCDEIDNDCDGAIDEAATMAAWRLFFIDADGDGFGARNDLGTLACAASVPGRALAPGDCDDAVATTYPGAPELCNRRVDDCNNWPSDATSAPARSSEDFDRDGAAAYDAPCEGGYPKIDCADRDASRTHCDPVAHPIATERFSRVRVGDLDGDGDLDVVASRANAVAVFWNDGTGGSFIRETIDGATDGEPGALPGLALVDVDGDGDLDVLSSGTELRGGDLGWYERAGPGTWTWHRVADDTQHFGASARPAADLVGDGWVDIAATTDRRVELWTRGVAGEWSSTVLHDRRVDFANPVFGDVDGDGRPDLVYGIDDDVGAVLDPGSLASPRLVSLCATSGEVDLELMDVEPDGTLDVVGLESAFVSTRPVLCRNPGAGAQNWPSSNVGSSVSGPTDLELVDLDGDGDGDVVVGGRDLQWHERRGTSYTTHDLARVTSGSVHVAVGDMDGDGDLDIVLSVAGSSDAPFVWYEMSGGAFSAP